MIAPLPFLRLLQLFDSQFPVGAFAQSGGLETYAQAGAGLETLRELATNQIDAGWGRGELAAACLAWSAAGREDAADGLAHLCAMADACKVVPAMRDASVRLGARTLTLMRRLYPDRLNGLALDPSHHAVVVGATGSRLELPLRELLLAYAQSLLAGTMAAATRCMPIGPGQAQALVVELQPRLARAVDLTVDAPEDRLFTCTPALDIRCEQQQHLTTRLFQS